MKKIISVINQKGGVGKTTTSINFSCCLAFKGYRTLLIDFDPQAHSTIGLDVNPESYQYAVHDVLVNKRNIREVIQQTKIKNLDLVPSHIRLDFAEQWMTSQMFKETWLFKAIRNLDYDFIVIDCRPTLGTLTVNALYACNFIMVPCEMARYSLDGFADLMNTVENVKNNEDLEKEELIRIFLTKFDSRKKISIDWMLSELELYKDLLFDTKIRQNEALNQAHMSQEPVFTFKPNSSGAEDYESLTNEFLNLCHLPLEKN